ncbi:uncharacterized protein METZ01_LOCUS273734 [marine metagenome]|uniref:LTXXQ motif family protein n=1 Tax=marine metagenome TaxID=408172 RepID=A0A382K8T0_9ZZZZ|tara:strand:- start:623 stop:1048 length:426 start_codon:yes stop_codon:yes gene_type:complete
MVGFAFNLTAKERKYYMKKLVMFAIATILAMHVVQADDDKKKKAWGKGGIQALLKQLDLNADQKKKLDEFNKANRDKNAEVRKFKGDERKAKMREITLARNAKLKEILTKKQQTKLKELKAAKKEKKKKSRASNTKDRAKK